MRSLVLAAAGALAAALPASALAQGLRCFSGDGTREVSCDDASPAPSAPEQTEYVDPGVAAQRAEEARQAAEHLRRLQEAERQRIEAARLAYRRMQERVAELEQFGRDTVVRWGELQAALDQPRRPHLEISVLNVLRAVRLPRVLAELVGPAERAGSVSLYLAQSQSLLDACTLGPAADPSCVDARLTLETARTGAHEGRAPVGSSGLPSSTGAPADSVTQLGHLVDEAIALRERLLAAQQRLEAARSLPDEAARQAAVDEANFTVDALRGEAAQASTRAAELGARPARPWRVASPGTP